MLGIVVVLRGGSDRVTREGRRRCRLDALAGDVPDQHRPAPLAGLEEVVEVAADLACLPERAEPDRDLEAGDLRLNPATHQVWRGDTAVELTPRQFSMLEFLLRRAGDVVSKATILAHVWDFSFEGDPNIVEVYVRQLRLRIDEPFGRNSVQTVRLVGYRLDPEGG